MTSLLQEYPVDERLEWLELVEARDAPLQQQDTDIIPFSVLLCARRARDVYRGLAFLNHHLLTKKTNKDDKNTVPVIDFTQCKEWFIRCVTLAESYYHETSEMGSQCTPIVSLALRNAAILYTMGHSDLLDRTVPEEFATIITLIEKIMSNKKHNKTDDTKGDEKSSNSYTTKAGEDGETLKCLTKDYVSSQLKRCSLFALNAFARSTRSDITGRIRAIFRNSFDVIRQENFEKEQISALSEAMAYAETMDESYLSILRDSNHILVLIPPVLGFCIFSYFTTQGKLLGLISHAILVLLIIGAWQLYRRTRRQRCLDCYDNYRQQWVSVAERMAERFEKELRNECNELKRILEKAKSRDDISKETLCSQVNRGIISPNHAEVIDTDWAVPVDLGLFRYDNNIVVEPVSLCDNDNQDATKDALETKGNGHTTLTENDSSANSGQVHSTLDTIQENDSGGKGSSSYMLPQVKRIDELLNVEQLANMGKENSISVDDLKQLSVNMAENSGSANSGSPSGIVPEDLTTTLTELAERLRENGSEEMATEVDEYVKFAKALQEANEQHQASAVQETNEPAT